MTIRKIRRKRSGKCQSGGSSSPFSEVAELGAFPSILSSVRVSVGCFARLGGGEGGEMSLTSFLQAISEKNVLHRREASVGYFPKHFLDL